MPKLFTRLLNIGDARSPPCQAASSAHRQRGADELATAGVGIAMARLRWTSSICMSCSKAWRRCLAQSDQPGPATPAAKAAAI
jgi:hypothetical protein